MLDILCVAYYMHEALLARMGKTGEVEKVGEVAESGEHGEHGEHGEPCSQLYEFQQSPTEEISRKPRDSFCMLNDVFG